MASPGEDYHARIRATHLRECAKNHEQLNTRMIQTGSAGEFNDLMSHIRRHADGWTLTVKQHGQLRALFMAYFGEGSNII